MLKRLLLCLLTTTLSWASPDWVHREGTKLLDSRGQVVLLKGINLGNWWVPEGYMFGFEKCTSPREIERMVLELLGPQPSQEFWLRYRQEYIQERDLAWIAELGLNAVRVPLHHRDLRDPRELARLDWLVERCRHHNLWVLLDLHAAPQGQTGTNIDDGAGYPWFFEAPQAQWEAAQLWGELAQRYRDEPTVVGYELLNEPIPNFPHYGVLKARLDGAYRQMGRAIREADSRHLLFLEGAEWGTDFSCVSSDWDEQLVLAFHHYWSDPKEADRYLTLREQRGCPLVLTESGENSDAWVEQFRVRLDQHQVGWFFWPYKKMKTNSCLVKIPSPSGWEQMVAYADCLDGDSRRKIRPPQARAMLAQLLENLAWERCLVQPGYRKALTGR